MNTEALAKIQELSYDNSIMSARLLAKQDTIENLIDFISNLGTYKISYVPVKYKLNEPIKSRNGFIHEIHSMSPIFTEDFKAYMDGFHNDL